MEEKDIEIEIQDEAREEEQGTQLPLNFLSFGEIGQTDVKIYIKQDVYKALEKLAESDTEKELGSILIGDYAEEHGKLHVVISGYVEAKYTDASAATLTFTHETWDYVHKEHEKKYPDKKIIGWQHTHPNYGIFLSNYDMFIHENFFNLPFQVAYVIDPVQNLRGFFQWKDGKVEKLKGYYIYDEVGKPIKIQQTKRKKEEPKKEKEQEVPAKPSGIMTAIMAILCVTVFILSFAVIWQHSSFAQQRQLLTTQMKMQTQQLEQQQNQIDALQKKLNSLSIQDLIARLEECEDQLEEQEKLIEEMKAMDKENEDSGTEVRFVMHTVTSGETLITICRQYGIDYYANKKILLGLNGISNPSKIYVGQNILIPVTE